MEWKSKIRLVVLIADAPCHGTIYHESGDDYPEGDPSGLIPEVLISQLALNNISLFFAKINNGTDTMIKIWREHYKQFNPGKSIKSFVITNEEDFMANIADCIGSCIAQS